MPDPQRRRARRVIASAEARLARYGDVARVVAFHVVRRVVESSERALGECLMRLSPRSARELARRHRKRAQAGPHWFTGDESALVQVLANLIVPSDETAPGVADLALAGRPAVVTLERLVAGSPSRQAVYARGLVALDRLAHAEGQARFVALPEERQVKLLQFVDAMHQKWSRSTSLAARIRTRTAMLYHNWSGLSPAVTFFRTLVQDVLQVFYTDPVSWEWLDYDGPPMPLGYASLVARRSLLAS